MRYLYPITLLLCLAGFVWAFVGLPDGRLLFSSVLVAGLATLRLS